MSIIKLGIAGIFIMFTAMSCCQYQSPDLAVEKEKVYKRGEQLSQFENEKNLDSVMIYYADDAVVQSAGYPEIKGKEAIQATYKEFFSMENLKEFKGTSTDVVVANSGDMAYEYGQNKMVMAMDSTDYIDNGKHLTVWRKMEGEWYIVALSFSSDAQPPME